MTDFGSGPTDPNEPFNDPPTPGQPAPGSFGPPQQQPPQQHPPFNQQINIAQPSHNVNNTRAITSAISGGIGLVLVVATFCCPPVFFLSVIASLVGLVIGIIELKAIKAGSSDPTNRSLAVAGIVMSGIGVGLFVIGMIAIAALFGFATLVESPSY